MPTSIDNSTQRYMQASYLDPVNIEAMAHNPKISKEAKANALGQQLDGTYFSQYLKEAMKPAFEGYVTSGLDNPLNEYIFTQNIAEQMAQNGMSIVGTHMKQVINPRSKS